ncbi:hypothetical protein ACI7RC_23995 [Brevibacillus sp. B_LB10_24]|uniref:hypothetical protein n=1 Tax=Brevibacillus sp. B_LB10_24 TaxID=3380645 RepID=UPI0038B9BE93
MKKTGYQMVLLALSLLITLTVLQGYPASAKTASINSKVSYKAPDRYDYQEYVYLQWYGLAQATKATIKAKNAIPAEEFQKNQLTYNLEDIYGESVYTRPAVVYYHENSKRSFFLALFHFIGVLSPHYPEGYDPKGLEEQIASIADEGKKREAMRKRIDIEAEARIQALIDQGFVLKEEAEDPEAELTKTLVAHVLYRMFQNEVPYQKRKAVANTDDIALRWAVEVGLPGYQLDEKGRVLSYGENFVDLERASLFDFLYLFFPSRWTGEGWQYYQFDLHEKPDYSQSDVNWFLRINGQPYYKMVNSPSINTGDKAFLQAKDKAEKELIAFLQKNVLSLISEVRTELLKPRLYNWKEDVIEDPRFKGYVTEYRKSKSEKTLQAAHQAIRKAYRLTRAEDSLEVIRSVFKNIK